jgi:hypothetical protein
MAAEEQTMAAFIEGAGNQIEWHVGEPLPAWVYKVKVLKIQADGDELTQILERGLGRSTSGADRAG